MVQEQLDAYVKHLVAERNASPHTVSNYRREILQFAAFARARGVNAWPDVTPGLLRQWLADLHARGYVKASVARRISELRAFYSYMRVRGLIDVNPLQGILSPKLPQRLPRPLTSEEIDTLLAAPDLTTPQGQRDRAMLELLYGGGLRVSELLAVDTGDVSLGEGQVHVTGKGAKERIALIGHPAIEVLKRYLAEGRPQLLDAAQQSGGKPRADGKWLPIRPQALFLNRFI
jgi:site-specific recombinase XerD